MNGSTGPVLELLDVHKSFGGTAVIRGVTLSVHRGQRHALIGPNGAGKSTLFNLISGQFSPSAGEILLEGQSIAGLPPHVINRRGLSRSFQITNLFPRMTVAENLRISVMGQQGYRFTLLRPITNLRQVTATVEQYLEQLRLQRRAYDLAGDLAYSEQRALEIGMALATNPLILLLDEPTSGMSREESAYVVELIRLLTHNKTLLVVEHDMSVVFNLCDQTSVLVYGEILASGTPEQVRADHRVQEAYLGEEAA